MGQNVAVLHLASQWCCSRNDWQISMYLTFWKQNRQAPQQDQCKMLLVRLTSVLIDLAIETSVTFRWQKHKPIKGWDIIEHVQDQYLQFNAP